MPLAVLARVTADILAEGADAAARRGDGFAHKWGLLYTWHDADYLGAAHGLAGILQTILHVEAAGVALNESDAGRVRAGTMALAESLLPSGNMTTRYEAKRGSDDRLVQWCHGAPGFLLLAAASAAHKGPCGIPAARLARPAAAAAECVWCVHCMNASR